MLSLRVLHIVAGLPLGGGISQSVPRLCESLCAYDCEVTLASTGIEGCVSSAAISAQSGGVSLHLYKPSAFKALCLSWEMLRGLPLLVKTSDIVHVHSQWTFPVWWGCYLAVKYNKPLVITPRGCLAPERLKISAIKKKIAGWLFDRRFLRRASVIHATCEAEAGAILRYIAPFSGSQRLSRHYASGLSRDDYCDHKVVAMTRLKGRLRRWFGLRNAAEPQIVVVPNGVDLESFDAVPADREFVDASWPVCKGKRIALFLSRLDPIKDLESLITAWEAVFRAGGAGLSGDGYCGHLVVAMTRLKGEQASSTCPTVGGEWVLVIAGSGDAGYERRLRQQVEKAGIGESVKFIGSVFGEAKVKLMKAAGFFVLPTKNENFGIVVAESLACGVPVITTKGAPWAELLGSSGRRPVGAGLSGDGYYDHSVVAMTRLKGRLRRWFGLLSGLNASQGGSGLSCVEEPTGSSSFILQPSSFAASGRSGWWVDVEVESLAEALAEAMALSDEERRVMGANGRRIVEQKYQWGAVAKQMRECYATASLV
ncbi:MAG: glycosyltransferase [Bacteroidales bacterium]|nr:glycosyltransferase [Bacteroidales bacterium]